MTQTSAANSNYAYTATVTFTADPTGLAGGNDTGVQITFGVNGAIFPAEVLFDVYPQPNPQPTGGTANAASAGQAPPSVVAPGSYVAIYGAALAGNKWVKGNCDVRISERTW
jgi:hypothetical protein